MQKTDTTRTPATATMTSNYGPEVELENDIAFVARMASILADRLESSLHRGRARSIDGTCVTLTFQEESLLDLEFAAEELRCRSKKIVDDYDAIREQVGAA